MNMNSSRRMIVGKRFFTTALAGVFTALVISACADKIGDPTADIALVNAGTIGAGDIVTLDGSASEDSKNGTGAPLSYSWRFVSVPSGSAATFNSATLEVVSFVADQYGDYVVGLIVSNGKLSSEEEQLTVTVGECGIAVPVVDSVTATPDPANTGDLVTLTAVVSDADNSAGCDLSQTLTVSSEFVGKPTGSLAELAPSSGLVPGFTADLPGDYVVRTTVTDTTGLSSSADTTISVAECGNAIPAVDSVTASPAAPNTGDLVTLTTVSSDSDNNNTCDLAQAMTVVSEFIGRPAGSIAELTPAEGLLPAFVADVPGTYIVRTTVTDSTGKTSFVENSFTVDICGSYAPDAQIEAVGPVLAGPGDNVVSPITHTGTPMQLDGSASTDPDAGAPCNLDAVLTYTWTFLEKPAASTATLNDPALINPSFTPDRPGFYLIQLEVGDGLFTDTALIRIEANPVIYVGANTGFSVEWVDGGAFFSSPEGVTVDAAGNIYVVQNGSGVVTRTANGVTEYFSAGGYLRAIHDIDYYAADDSFLVTSDGFDAIIALSDNGAQELWTDFGDVDGPRGIDVFVDAAGNDSVVVAESNQDQIRFFNATTAAGTGTWDNAGNLNNPWGVAGAAIGGNNTYFTISESDDELWRTNPVNTQIFNNFDSAREVVIGPSGDLYVSDVTLGAVYRITNCGGGNCTGELIAWGPWAPWGLAFESNTSLLVTDRTGNSLYRITGTF